MSHRLADLRKLAKRELKALRAGDPRALERLERTLPEHGSPPVLREVQHALAREHGFGSWAQLKEHYELHERPVGSQSLVDEFLERACWFGANDGPSKWQRAAAILGQFPDVATASLHSAVASGDLDHVRRRLERDPLSVHEKGGPQRWEPLLFLCYCRLPNNGAEQQALAIAEALLAAGADPNVYTSDGHNRFTALCGVIGQGETRQPEHALAKSLARLLLERGASPNQSQALYNEHLHSDHVEWLSLLCEFGLDARTPFDCTGTETNAAPAFDFLIAQASANGHVERVRFLLAHGANPNARSTYDQLPCYQAAILHGHTEISELLTLYGAAREPLSGKDAFLVACRQGRLDEVRALAEAHPEYLKHTRALVDPIRLGQVEVVRLLLELGMSPKGQLQHEPLYVACRSARMTELLLEHGADPFVRIFGGHSLAAAALWHGHRDMACLHARLTRDVFDAVLAGDADLLQELLCESPEQARRRGVQGNTPLHLLPSDAALAEPIIVLLLRAGANPEAENDAGQTPLAGLIANGRDDIVDLFELAREAITPE